MVKEVCLDLIKTHRVVTRQWLFLAKDFKLDLAILFNSFSEMSTLWNNSWVCYFDGATGERWEWDFFFNFFGNNFELTEKNYNSPLLVNKKTSNPIQKWEKIWTDTPPKKVYELKTSRWKDAEHHKSLENVKPTRRCHYISIRMTDNANC